MLACGGTKGLSTPEENIPESAEEASTEEDIPENTVNEDSLKQAKLVEIYKEELTEVYRAEANGIVNFYILAQQRFYNGDFTNALSLINRASVIRENADVLALKGSIYLGLGEIENFESNWRKALELDADVPIPPLPYVVQQLQDIGLIDSNLKKNF